MREEALHSFPRPEQNDIELVHVYIESILKKEGISLKRVGMQNKTCTITTDIDVPEEVKSNIYQYSTYKGITVKFQTREKKYLSLTTRLVSTRRYRFFLLVFLFTDNCYWRYLDQFAFEFCRVADNDYSHF